MLLNNMLLFMTLQYFFLNVPTKRATRRLMSGFYTIFFILFFMKNETPVIPYFQNYWMFRLEVELDFHSMGRSSGAVEQQEEWSLAFTSSSLGNFAALTLVQTCEELPLKQTIQHSFPWLPFLTFKEVDSRIWCHISISDIILGSKVGKVIGFLD